MRIALLSWESPDKGYDVDRGLLIRSVFELFSLNHSVRHFIFSPEPNPHMLGNLRNQDAIIMYAPDFLTNTSLGRNSSLPQILLEPKIPIIPFGINSGTVDLHNLADSNQLEWFKLWHRSGESIAVEDEACRTHINAVLKTNACKLVGSMGIFLKTNKLAFASPRWLLVPNAGRSPKSFSEGKYSELFSHIFDELNAVQRPLFLAQTEEDISQISRPGLWSLYSPKYPVFHAKAIVSAQAIISARAQPILVGVTNGVPAMALSHSEDVAALVRHLSIPTVNLTPDTTAAEVSERFQQVLRDYPWKKIQNEIEAQKNRIAQFFKEKDITILTERPGKKPEATRRPAEKTAEKPLHIATCVFGKEEGQLMALIANLCEIHSGKLVVHVLALSEGIESKIRERDLKVDIHLYIPSDVMPQEEMRRAQGLSPNEMRARCKPNFLLHLLQKTEGEFLYTDIHVLFFRSPAKIFDSLKNRSLLLFPNWNRTLNFNRRYGLYNSRLLAVTSGAAPVLAWWNRLVLHRCSENPSSYFTDQGYLDLLPLYFPDRIAIYRDLDEGVATWNVESLGIYFRRGQEIAYLPGGTEIGSLLIDGADPIGAGELKQTWGQLVQMFDNTQATTKHAELECLRQQKAYSKEARETLKVVERLPDFLWEPSHHKTPNGFSVLRLGRALFKLISPIAQLVGKLKSRRPSYHWDESKDFWIPMQREILFPPNSRSREITPKPKVPTTRNGRGPSKFKKAA